jgi:hypothetical protein
VRAAWYVQTYQPRYEPIEYSFSILNSVNVQNFTQWSIVYDMETLAIHYKTLYTSAVRTISFKDFDFSPKTPALYADINANVEGPSAFLDYSSTANSTLIRTVVFSLKENNAFKNFPLEVVPLMVSYPETVVPLSDD